MKITEYNQLKHGMKVKVTCISGEHGEVPVVGKISINESGRVFVCHDDERADGREADDKLGYKYSWYVYTSGRESCGSHKDLETCEKTLDDLEVGDVLVDEDGEFRKVLGVCEQVVFTTACAEEVEDLIRYHLVYTWSVAEMKQRGFTIYQPEETEGIIELTPEDIAKLKGVDVSKIKIKK